MQIHAVVPCFNEAERVEGVLKPLLQSHEISKVIVVDDGSTDNTAQVLSRIKGITVLTHKKNQGKTAAVKAAFQKTTEADYVLFLDADLTNIVPKNISDALHFLLDNSLDMLLVQRGKVTDISQFTGFEQAFTGIRFIKRQNLTKYQGVFNVKGFLFEATINKLMFDKDKIGLFVFPNVGHFNKIDKRGFIGYLENAFIGLQIIQLLGIKEFIWQLYYVHHLHSSCRRADAQAQDGTV